MLLNVEKDRNKNRRRLDIVRDVLSIALVRVRKTRIMYQANLNFTERGLYLPPKCLKNFESSIVFIPEKPNQALPTLENVTEEKLLSPNHDGMFLTPTGLSLSRLFENELGVSFTKTDMTYIKEKLPKLLVEDLEIVEDAEVQIVDDKITIELTGSIFNEVCRETRKLPRTHEQIGCLLSSAFACVLAKATGKAVTIEREEEKPNEKTTTIKYQIIGE